MGLSVREAFRDIIRDMGQTIIVHNNWNTPQVEVFEVRGLKNTKKSGGGTVFQFAEQVEGIIPSSVLQVKGARDLWKVEDTEDHVTGETLIYFEARVVKMNQEGKEVGRGSAAKNVINIGGNVQGGLQVGTHHSMQNVAVSSNEGLEKIFSKMFAAIQDSNLGKYDKEDAVHSLQQVQALTKEEKTPDVIERAKKKLELFQSVIKTGTELGNIVLPYVPMIADFFSKQS